MASKNYEVTVAGTLASSGGVLEIDTTEGIKVQEGTVVSSIIARPGGDREALIFSPDYRVTDIIRDSSALWGLEITEIQIEEYEKEVKEKGFPLRIGGGISSEGGSFELDIKNKGQVIKERKMKIIMKKP